MEIAPRDGVVLRDLATLFRALGRIDEAVKANELAAQADPANPGSHMNSATLYVSAKDTGRAFVSARKALDLSPGMSGVHSVISDALLLEGDAAAALDEIKKEPDEGWQRIGLPMIYHALGEHEQSDRALEELIEVHAEDAAYDIAYVYAFRGDVDGAFEWLDKAIETNDPGLQEILVQPFFESIHDDPRWVPFLRKIGRAPEQLAGIKLDIRLADDVRA